MGVGEVSFTGTYTGGQPVRKMVLNENWSAGGLNPLYPMVAPYPMWLDAGTWTWYVEWQTSQASMTVTPKAQLVAGRAGNNYLIPALTSQTMTLPCNTDQNTSITYVVTTPGYYTLQFIAQNASGNFWYTFFRSSSALPAAATAQQSASLSLNSGGTVYFTLSSASNSPVIQISKNGGSYVNTTSQTPTLLSGWTYSLTLTSAETNTAGQSVLRILNSGTYYYVTVPITANNLVTLGRNS
jgi:hypothetical protein